jgi:uncharacterized membrane protein
MPSLAAFHPPIVHFAIGLLVAGVVLRWLSLTGRAPWSGPAAATLLLAGTLAAVAAARSGAQAHGPVERVPGSAPAVQEHEEWGIRTRNLFLLLALFELAALGLRSRGRAKPVLIASGVLGLAGLLFLYEAGEHGGELVYSYAGGVGIRTGAPEDVGRLLLAGLYHQAQADRTAHRPEDAATLVELASRRFPSDPTVQLMAAESMLLDRKDAPAAISLLTGMSVPREDRRLRMRRAFLLADALEAAGRKADALAALEDLKADFPQNERLKKKIDELSSSR